MTAEELWLLPGDGNRRELVRGVVREMPPAGGEHGGLTSNLEIALGAYVKAHRLGRVFAAETGFVLGRDPDTVRAPDCAFVTRERVPVPLPKEFLSLAPDLAIEVVSPSDTAEDVNEKVAEWLKAGVRLVWVVHPRTRTVIMHHSLREATTLYENDTLSGEGVVPGFEMPVRDIFE